MGTKIRMLLAVAAALAATQLATATAWGFGMCGSFRLKDLLKQADTVLVLEFGDANSDGLARAKVVKVFKGDANLPAGRTLDVDFLAMGDQFSAQGKGVMKIIADGKRQAVLFSGTFDTNAGPDETGTEEAHVKGFLCIAGRRVVLERSDDGLWEMQRIWEFLNGAWCGGTDMLVRAVEFLQSDADADLPTSSGNEWDFAGIARIGKVAGRAFAAALVDLRGKGACDLFVAADSGDRVFRLEGAAWRDITGTLKLTSRSRVFAWGDFDGDGRLDLASWDGNALAVFAQQADGTFAAGRPCEVLSEQVVSLSAVNCGEKNKAGLLVGTPRWPVLLRPGAGGFAEAVCVGRRQFPVEKAGEGGLCLVADFDGDGIPDVLQLFSKAGFLFHGRPEGGFTPQDPVAIEAGPGPFTACAGDFDQDGLPDIFIAGPLRNRLYQNRGGGGWNYEETLDQSCELAYIAKNGGIAVQAADVSGDGLQSLFILYGTKMAPHILFNLGFRCFQQARDLDLPERKGMIEKVDLSLVEDAAQGQQAGCFGDFNGDGAMDMALVLANGDVCVFPREVTRDRPAMGLRLSLAPGAERVGPVSVTVTQTTSGPARNLGSWTVPASGEPVLIGTQRAGPMQVQWRWPDGEIQTRRVKVRDAVVPVILDAAKP